LLGQLAAAQLALEAVLASLAQSGADSALIAEARANLSELADLRQQVGSAGARQLAGLRAEIITATSAGLALAQQVRTGIAEAASNASGNIAQAASDCREQVNNIMRGMKDFDPFLHFTSPEDETAYRAREAERQAYIARQQARHTPESDLNASGAAIGQMVDAKAHGAGDCPAFQKRWDALVITTEKLREQIRRNGGSTKEFDDRLRDELRATLKAKGLTDAEIDARFAANPDPLQAVKAYMKGDDDVAQIQRSAQRIETVALPTSPQARDDVRNLIASLQAAGVVADAHDANASPSHGVAIASSTPATSRTI